MSTNKDDFWKYKTASAIVAEVRNNCKRELEQRLADLDIDPEYNIEHALTGLEFLSNIYHAEMHVWLERTKCKRSQTQT